VKLRRAVRRPASRPEPAALVDGAPLYQSRRVAGAVEQFKRDRLRGWIAVDAGAPATRVGLAVNGVEIAATWAAEPNELNNWGEVRPFRFWLHDLWDYVGTQDEIAVIYNGAAVPIVGHGMLVRPAEHGSHSAAELLAKISAGHVFGQTGRLQLSKKLDTEWQRAVLAQFGRVRALLSEAHGYDAFFVYGSLLGVVREDGFIGHDLDFDAAYVSRETDGPAAAAELRDIAYTFIEHGFAVDSRLSHLHITDPNGARIDLFHLYFGTDGKLCFPFGVAGTGSITADEWAGVTERPFSAGTAVVPVIAERMVEYMYGADWRQPKPGFMWYLDRTQRAPEGLMPDDMADDIYWASFYARTEFNSPSSFFATVNDRPDLPDTVLDIGCGDGRDALAFAAAERSVVGLDRSETAIRHATAKAAAQHGLAARFSVCDVADDADLRSRLGDAITSAQGPVLFYLRFFLHAITEPAQETLMAAIAELARPGDMFAAEFRTTEGEESAENREGHFRRYLNGPAFSAALSQRWGFDVLEEIESEGLSVYEDDDPLLCRVIARRP
jgi:SAM-dependent methyltransferase